MEVYNDGYGHCFGCGAHVLVSDLGIAAPRYSKKVENLEESIQRIEALPKADIRGLSLPTDGDSYYVVWPDRSYYNRRFFDISDERGKYKCPAGHQKRLFWARQFDRGTLYIVEGEINALSVALAADEWDAVSVCSPGGAGDFYSKAADKNLPIYMRYGRIVIIADSDKAGAIAAIQLKANLAALGHAETKIHLMTEDANDILVKKGKYDLQKEIYKTLDMPRGV